MHFRLRRPGCIYWQDIQSDCSGYGGNILVKAGIDSESRITGIRILEHKGDPGLGSRITEASFSTSSGTGILLPSPEKDSPGET